MATVKKAATAPQVNESAEPPLAAVPATKTAVKAAAKKAPARKAARKAAPAKALPPAEPTAATRISPTAAWPFPTGSRP
jgi:hypothetical protein